MKGPSGQVEDRPVISLDLMPTFVAAAGDEVDKRLDGANLTPYPFVLQDGTLHLQRPAQQATP